VPFVELVTFALDVELDETDVDANAKDVVDDDCWRSLASLLFASPSSFILRQHPI
jgi:hypothetical protein